MRRRLIVAIVSALVIIVAVCAAGVFFWAKYYSGNSWTLRSTAAKLQGVELAEPPQATTGFQPRALTPVPGNISALTEAEAQRLWNPVTSAASEGKWQAWAVIVDADSGEVILDAGADKAHTPASTTKLLTALTALDALNFNDRLKTSAVYSEGTLYLRGEGDLLLSADAGDSGATNGHAGLADLADQVAKNLQEKGVTSVELDYQSAFFPGQMRAPVWKAQEVDDYAGNIGAYAIDAGANPTGETQFVADSARAVADRFAQLLTERGIAVSGVGATNTDPKDGAEVGSVSSATIGEQIEYMLHKSDNTLAEQYCHLSAGPDATFETATANVISHTASLGIDTTGLTLEDCSGLSANNRISGEQLVDALQASAVDADSGAVLLRLLPRAGLNGTMAERLDESGLTGNVQAKTGSLASVSTMAGVMTTASGQNLLFAIGSDMVPDSGGWATRDAIDNFLAAVANS